MTACSTSADSTTTIKTSTPARRAKRIRIPATQGKPIHRVNLRGFLFGLQGSFVSLDFVKLNGETRKLTGRLGVHSYTKGGTNTVAAEDRPYLVVFEVSELQYRAVNLSTVTQVRAQHMIHDVIG